MSLVRSYGLFPLGATIIIMSPDCISRAIGRTPPLSILIFLRVPYVIGDNERRIVDRLERESGASQTRDSVAVIFFPLTRAIRKRCLTDRSICVTVFPIPTTSCRRAEGLECLNKCLNYTPLYEK